MRQLVAQLLVLASAAIALPVYSTLAAAERVVRPTLLGIGQDVAVIVERGKMHVADLDGLILRSSTCEIVPLLWPDVPEGFGGANVGFDEREGEFFGLGIGTGEGWEVVSWNMEEPCPRVEATLPPSEQFCWFVGAKQRGGARLIGLGGIDRGLSVERVQGGDLAAAASGPLVPQPANDARSLGVVAATNGVSSLVFRSQVESSVIPDVLVSPYLFCSLSADSCFFSDDTGRTWSDRGSLPPTDPPGWRRLWRTRFDPFDGFWYAFVEANDERNGQWFEGWKSRDDGVSWEKVLGRDLTIQSNKRSKYFAGPFFNEQGVWIQLSNDEDLRADDWVVRVLHLPADEGEPRWINFEAPSRREAVDRSDVDESDDSSPN